MISERKFIRLTWFARILMLFMTFSSLFLIYIRSVFHPDIMELYILGINALIGGTIFFTTFPGLRIFIRVNQLKKRFSEKAVFESVSTAGISNKDDVRTLIKFVTMIIITLSVVISNIVLVRLAYLNGNNSRLFIHMAVVIAMVLGFNTF